MKAFVSGEGRHELGKWDESPQNRSTSRRSDGVLVELARKRGTELTVCGGITWRQVPKYTARGHRSAEEGTLRKLVQLALDAEADTLIWARDTDLDKERQRQLERAQTQIKQESENELSVRGGPAIPSIDAWILAIAGDVSRPEELTPDKLKELASARSLGSEDEKIALIRSSPLDTTRSASLKNWVEQF